MARRKSSGAKRRSRTDWTYNERSYAPSNSTLNPGIAGALAFPLTLSQNARRLVTRGSPGIAPVVGDYQSWAAIPEGSRQRCFAIEGALRLSPATWNVGNEFMMGWRLLHAEMDPVGNDMLTPVNYSLFVVTADGSPAQWANAGFLKEGRVAQLTSGTAISSNGQWIVPIRWRSAKGATIGNDRALFLYVESILGSVNIRVTPFLRCLMEVSGQG